MPRHVIIHGHFYQPPRENPWIDRIEKLDTPLARIIEGYNHQIDLQCYTPNSMAFLIANGTIKSVNNYASMSFNAAPTLLDWLRNENFMTYQRIIQGDFESQMKNNGHGNALAQVYNHVIMPLASRRDKLTQMYWGKTAFEKVFDRPPEGMWLAEAAIDQESVECLIEVGMKFAIAHPRGAEAVRALNSPAWENVDASTVDVTKPYLVKCANGELPIFFMDPYYYDHIGSMLKDANRFIASLNERCPEDGTDKVILVCTDGELYGHWEHYGERFLAYLYHEVFPKNNIKITNLGNYLASHRPVDEVRLTKASSWSCVHGVDRWCANCGCSDVDAGTQQFRAPLREALNCLAEDLYVIYVEQTTPFFIDPLQARHESIAIDKKNESSWIAFLNKHLKTEVKPLSLGVQQGLYNLLESQRYAQLMFTSCGWFFSTLCRIEPIKILQYASRAIEWLCMPLLIEKVEKRFTDLLEKAEVPLHKEDSRGKVGNGKELYLYETRYRAPKFKEEIEIASNGECTYVKIPYDLEKERSEHFQWKMRLLIDESSKRMKEIILDLNEVNRMDNFAVTALLALVPKASTLGIRLKIYCSRQNIVELLKLAHLTDFIEVQNTLKDAQMHFSKEEMMLIS